MPEQEIKIKTNRGDGLIQPNQENKNGVVKKISKEQNDLMERKNVKIITEDGRELLK